MIGASLFGALEGHVLPKVRQTVLFGPLVPTANVQDKAAVNHLGVRNLLMRYPDSVG